MSRRLSILGLPILLLGLVLSSYALVGSVPTEESCSSAMILNCSEDFITISYSPVEGDDFVESTCFEEPLLEYLHEAWFQFVADGVNNFYFEAVNSNMGMNIYSGTCDDLELQTCVLAQIGGGAYWEGGLPEGTYFIQLLNLIEPEADHESDLIFTCYEPIVNDCFITIDFVDVADCKDQAENIAVSVGGTTNREYVTVEVMTDIGPFQIYTGTVHDGLWNCEFSVQGQYVLYIAADAGDSESGCSDLYFDPIALPNELCGINEPNLLSFLVEAEQSCIPSTAEINFYTLETNVKAHTFTVNYDGDSRAYQLINPPAGTFNAYIKPTGCLQQAFSSLTIANDGFNVALEYLVKGDLDNSNAINIIDFSILSGSFNLSEGEIGFNPISDLDCSGGVNIIDISIFIGGFNLEGDSTPIDIPKE